MEAAAIITLISVGHWIESRVSVRASGALQKLLQLAPQTARRENSDGTEAEVSIAELKVGDAISLRPGDRVPMDGEVIEGDSAVDESMLTGESVPADKGIASKLYAGTSNLNGRLLMRVTQTGDETALARVIAAVQRAQTSRANIQRLGDRVSSVFVPIVVLIALAAGLWWGFAQESALRFFTSLAPYLWTAHPPVGAAAGFIIAAAVLIVACPCAMGLATPAAIMAGSNAAAKRGILIRDGVALEKAGEVTAVIFDKTGTLTMGKPEVAAFQKSDPETQESELKKIASSLARHSTHPISQTIAKISTKEINVTDWQEIRGSGVQANWKMEDGSSKMVKLGSLNWLRNSGVDLGVGEYLINEWSAQGATMVGFTIENSLAGLFAVKDAVKPGSAAVIEQLHRQGLKTFLVTGDNSLTAASIAKQAGIHPQNIFAEVRPEQKAEFVKKLQQQGERVAFVGDGINDAPALEQADLGIAVSRASDIAREAADIILLKSEIEAVPEALGLARATLRTIKQNLFWAFFYNAIGVPLAALGFMSPILCAAAMGFSDLIVIGNALRLRHWRMKD
jgi:Cu+-exporting ATPase